MTPIRGIVISVDYDDFLRAVLPLNLRFLDECLVVTSCTDEATKRVALDAGAKVHQTGVFFKFGSRFNKSLAIEEGFDVLGRHGWILIWDADILFPENFRLPALEPGRLYGPQRRMLDNPAQWTRGEDWPDLPLYDDGSFPGFFQLFHADDPHVAQHPWYEPRFTHAAGGDYNFQARWDPKDKVRLPFKVLHLGQVAQNWFGRTTKRIDGKPLEWADGAAKMMREFVRYKGWVHSANPPQSFPEFIRIPGMPEL